MLNRNGENQEKDQTWLRPQGSAAGKAEKPLVLKELALLLLKIGAAACAVALLLTLVYGLHRNADPDMSPSVKDGDLVLFYRLDKSYAAGDVLVLTFRGERQARRVVAIEGDTVDISDEGLLINGAIQQEPGVRGETKRYEGGAPLPVTLGEGQVFVLGDNRDNATDSRVYGAVNARDTQGTVVALLRRRGL